VPKGVHAENVKTFYERVQHSNSAAKLFENEG
jgi:truncated hemoglobin YjbI